MGFMLLRASARHQNRQKIVHTRKSAGNVGLSSLFKNSVNRIGDGGDVREISVITEQAAQSKRDRHTSVWARTLGSPSHSNNQDRISWVASQVSGYP